MTGDGSDSDDDQHHRAGPRGTAASTSSASSSVEEEYPQRDFIPTRPDVAELSEFADLEKVSIVSYNVLSQMGARRLLRADRGYVEASILSILRRRDVLLRELLSYDADIMCLQEVDDYDDFWASRLTDAGYDSVFASHPSQRRDDGLLVAFRKELFQLFGTDKIDLNDVAARVTDDNLIAKCRQDNHALVVHLQPWERSRLPSAVCVVTTQLASDPAHEPIRVLQTEFLCREIARINASFQLPILLAGTFNAAPSSDVYHIIHTGRRRPRPQAPAVMSPPSPEDPTPSSVRLTWESPPSSGGDGPITGYKIAIKNCTSATLGYMHEIELPGSTTEHVITTLSAGIPYQFRIAARNEHGYGPFSQPSPPVITPNNPTPARSATAEAPASEQLTMPLFIDDEIPPQVKPYAPSFGSGRTPRFENGERNLEVSPRKLLQARWPPEARQFETLRPRADRDREVVHGEQLESAYGAYQGYVSEPEFTFVGEAFIGTVDYIFYSATQFAPFQLLELPSLEDLEALGVDPRQPELCFDAEWAKHKPGDWCDGLKVTKNDDRTYMGEWVVPELPNAFARATPWLPNRVYPSDHLALGCVLAVRRENLAVEWN